MRKSNRKLAAINPLTELRRLLGTEDKPISTSKLAALADIPADTLRSTETGRRSFNAELRKRLARRGLEWQPEKSCWVFTYDRKTPLSLPLLESFRRLVRGNSFFQDVDVDCAMRRVIALLQKADEAAYRGLLLDLNDALETLRETYAVDGALEEFRNTELKFVFLRTASGTQTLYKNISGANMTAPEQLMNHSDKRKSKSDAKLEVDELGQNFGTVQPAA